MRVVEMARCTWDSGFGRCYRRAVCRATDNQGFTHYACTADREELTIAFRAGVLQLAAGSTVEQIAPDVSLSGWDAGAA